MNLASYLGLVHEGEKTLADTFRQVATGHGDEPDVRVLCLRLAAQCDQHERRLAPIIQRYGEAGADNEPERLHAEGLSELRSGPLGLLRDLQDVHMLATFVKETWTMIGQAARALRDEELVTVVDECAQQLDTQIRWLETRMKQAAPQALVVAEQ
jgi:rubrerythrin